MEEEDCHQQQPPRLGVIDFGDMVHSWTVCDPAIACAYMSLTPLGRKNPLQACCAFLRGYRSVRRLSSNELAVLRTLIACRLACSITLGAFSRSMNPENAYLSFHAKPACESLRAFWALPSEVVRQAFDECSGEGDDEGGGEVEEEGGLRGRKGAY